MAHLQFSGLAAVWRVLAVLLFLGALLFGTPAQPAAAATFTVNTTADTVDAAPGNGVCADASNQCSLRAAIMEANALPGPDTITLPAGTYILTRAGSDDNAANGDLDVTGAITINGAGMVTTIIQAGTNATNGIDKIFSFNPLGAGAGFAVNMSDLTLRYGRNVESFSSFNGDGGCFDFDGGTNGAGSLAITNVTVSDCSTTDGDGGGGTIFSPAGNAQITIQNSLFQNNIASRSIPNTSNAGGLAFFCVNNGASATLTINSSSISGNRAGAQGGGLFFFGACSGSATLDYQLHAVTITGNQAGGDGGGIYSVAPLTIDNAGGPTTISGNTSGRSGGGIWLNHSNRTSTISKVTIHGNSAVDSGGGIRLDSAATANVLNLSFSRLANNTAGAGKGSGLSVYNGTANAANNWWGCSSGPAAAPCDTARVDPASGASSPPGTGSVTAAPWLRLVTSAAPATLATNQSAALTASFNTNSAGGDVSANIDVLKGLPVTWTPVGGTLSGAQATVQNSGTAGATYTATDANAGNRAAAQVDNDGATSGSNVVGITVTPAGTTTTLTADTPDPSLVGQVVTVNYSVVSATGSSPTALSGNVTVSDGVDSCTGTAAAGQCALTLTTSGARTLTATYAGDSNFSGSTSPGVAHTVTQANLTTTSLTADTPDPSVVGQAVTVAYSVVANDGGTPSGDVTVSDGASSCTAAVAAGQCSLTFTSAGARTLTATYAGDGTFSGSSSAGEAHTVNPAGTTLAITADTPDPSAGGQAVIVQYSLSVNAPGAGVPTGNITAGDGVDTCTGTIATGQCTIFLTTDGARTLVAVYAGDSNFTGSTSAGEPHTVDATPPSVTINQAAGQADPTASSPIHFTVTFSEPVSGFTGSDVSLSGTAGATSAVVTGGPAVYDVEVSGMSANGAVTANIPAGAATDAVGNPNTASTSTDNTVTFLLDSTPPDTAIDSFPLNPSSSTSASFTFSGTDNQTAASALSFTCRLDGGAFSACTSPQAYSGLSYGSHTFQVRASDAAGNTDPTPASYTWSIQAATSLLYNGGQIVNTGSTFQPAAKLSSTVAACVSGQTIQFSLDANPTSGAAGSYTLGSAVTNASGQATLGAINTTGWLEGIYTIQASFSGTAACQGSLDEATLTAASPGSAANGGGWYTLSGSGRVNFGFTVRKTELNCQTNCAYKGQLLLINNGKWRLKGTLSNYAKLATGKGAASGTGDLFWWNPALNGGLGAWELAQTGVSYTINFYDSGKTGKSSTDTFGIKIVYTPVAPQPGSLPNAAPVVLKGGDIKAR